MRAGGFLTVCFFGRAEALEQSKHWWQDNNWTQGKSPQKNLSISKALIDLT